MVTLPPRRQAGLLYGGVFVCMVFEVVPRHKCHSPSPPPGFFTVRCLTHSACLAGWLAELINWRLTDQQTNPKKSSRRGYLRSRVVWMRLSRHEWIFQVRMGSSKRPKEMVEDRDVGVVGR